MPSSSFQELNVIAIDLGGTKVSAALVNPQGQILKMVKNYVQPEKGPRALFDQIAELVRSLLLENKSQSIVSAVGLASAGPLDPEAGVLLDATNLKTQNQGWGVVPIKTELEKRLSLTVYLENDAAASVLGEAWVGDGQNKKNLISITLGTGVGVGVMTNGELVRAGRFLHPEAGHMIINTEEKNRLCECGNYGCAEVYLSGRNFTRHIGQLINRVALTGEEVVGMARNGDSEVLKAFNSYSENLSIFIYNLSMLFAPELVLLSGGFASASDLFLPLTLKSLEARMKRHREGVDMLPQVQVSRFADSSSLLGAAFVAFKKSDKHS